MRGKETHAHRQTRYAKQSEAREAADQAKQEQHANAARVKKSSPQCDLRSARKKPSCCSKFQESETEVRHQEEMSPESFRSKSPEGRLADQGQKRDASVATRENHQSRRKKNLYFEPVVRRATKA